MKVLKYLSLASFTILLCSCASISREQCLAQDWFQLGRNDALHGLPVQLSAYKEECRKRHDLFHVEGKGYLEGHADGLSLFCTFEGGFKHGKRGLYDHNVCPITLQADFLRGYHAGERVYAAIQAEKRAKEEAERARKKLRERQASDLAMKKLKDQRDRQRLEEARKKAREFRHRHW